MKEHVKISKMVLLYVYIHYVKSNILIYYNIWENRQETNKKNNSDDISVVIFILKIKEIFIRNT